MAEDSISRTRQLRVAAGLRLFLRGANRAGIIMHIHRWAGGAPSQADLPGGVPNVPREIQDGIRRGLCLGLICDGLTIAMNRAVGASYRSRPGTWGDAPGWY